MSLFPEQQLNTSRIHESGALCLDEYAMASLSQSQTQEMSDPFAAPQPADATGMFGGGGDLDDEWGDSGGAGAQVPLSLSFLYHSIIVWPKIPSLKHTTHSLCL